MGETTADTIREATETIETALAKCDATTLAALPVMTRTVTLAAGMQHMRRAMSEDFVRRVFMPLQSTPLGFLTDKDTSGGYDWQTVRDCMIEGMIRGLQPVGNEINIIAGRCYAAKEGLRRLVRTYQGLTDFRVEVGVPVPAGDKQALVPISASWLMHGQPMGLACELEAGGVDRRISVRVNAGMGADAIIGKAERKLYRRVWEILSGCSIDEGDVIEVIGTTVATTATQSPAAPEQDGQRIKLGKRPTPTPEPQREPGQD